MDLHLNVIDGKLVEKYGGNVGTLDGLDCHPLEPIKDIKRERHLIFHVRLAEYESVKLSTDEQLEKLDGYVTIRRQELDAKEYSQAIGSLSYYQSRYNINIFLPADQYNDLVEAARLGRTPSFIMITERGMELGRGSSMKWDNNTSPHLLISCVTFSIPLSEVNQDSVAPTMANYLPPTRSDAIYLVKAMRELWIAIHGINTKLTWLVVFIVSVCVTALLLRY